LEETLGEGEFGKVVSARALNFRGRPGRKPWNKMDVQNREKAWVCWVKGHGPEVTTVG
jgi:hypothetical protein